MGPDAAAVALSATVTGVVAVAGGLLLTRLSPERPSRAALGAPLVVVASLAAGVAAATRAMLIGEHDYRTVIFVLLAGAPMALIIGVLLARRVHAMEQDTATERARRERDAAIETERRETIRWLSHDLRTPLAGIRLLAESARDTPEDLATVTTALDRILIESDRLDAMVEDITELSRLHGPAARARVELALEDLVSDAAATVAPLAEAAGVVLQAGASTHAVVSADPGALTRAVTNLIRNAVQHTPTEGTVTVTTSDSPASVVVRDGCGGIPADDLERLFEPGWRGDSARTSGTAGMGLGLAIAREVARAHGGQLTVANLPDATGCAFTLTLGEQSSR